MLSRILSLTIASAVCSALATAAIAETRIEIDGAKWNVGWDDLPQILLRSTQLGVEVDGKLFDLTAPAVEEMRFHDGLGAGRQIVQRWAGEISLERTFRVYDNIPFVIISTKIGNDTNREVSLGTAQLLGGSLQLDGSQQSPAAVRISDSTLLCEPPGTNAARDYAGSMINLVSADEKSSMLAGFVTAPVARPEISAHFAGAESSFTLSAQQRLLGRKLPPHTSIELGTLCVAAHTDPYAALENYARVVAVHAESPPRPRITSLWCSWYAHRMAMTEDLVLANAAVAAKYFKPLGMEFIQLDHGWQRGDVTGDWTANERFPHGLKWLAGELESRYGMKLGLWIAPTDVAATSQLFHDHPDWMLRDENGRPRVNWKWYWKPNPDCYELDTTNPAANRWMRDTFSRLTDEGAAYYKIDFIASSGGEHFFQSDPSATRGWTNLREAMRAVRAGAGETAHIRFCQTPPLLSVGLADSTIGGDDTGDAGNPQLIHSLRDNARSLAAGYWLNDSLYHREICDMSVRMPADVEEVRLRLALMTLPGCSVSFSDELQHLPPSRIRMMQQCLPPGAPPMRPLDLFQRAVPSIWKIHCKTAADEWDVYGLFNFEDTPQERSIELPDADQAIFEFWEEKFLGTHRASFAMTLAPHTSRIICVRTLTGKPQVIGTNMHVLQGYHELSDVRWDDGSNTLRGTCRRAPNMDGTVYIYVPEEFSPHFDFPLTEASAHLTHVAGPIWAREIRFDDEENSWSIPFDKPSVK